jgi:hypothetical protein
LFNIEVRDGQTAKPVFMSVDLETPLGFTSFLSNASNHRKVFIPSTFNMSKIIKSIGRQESHELVCDSEFYSLEAPGPVAEEYKQKCSTVADILVGSESGASKSSIFSGRATFVDPLTL